MIQTAQYQNAYLDGIKIKKTLESGALDGTVKPNIVNNLFNNHDVWIHHKTRSGHAHIEHSITKIHIGYQLHSRGGRKSNVLNAGHVKEIKSQLENHLKKLSDILKIDIDDFSKSKAPEMTIKNSSSQHSLFAKNKIPKKSHNQSYIQQLKR